MSRQRLREGRARRRPTGSPSTSATTASSSPRSTRTPTSTTRATSPARSSCTGGTTCRTASSATSSTRTRSSSCMGARGIAQRHDGRPLRRQEQLVRRVRVLVPQDLRPRGRAHPRRRPPEVDRRGPRADDRRAAGLAGVVLRAGARRVDPRAAATAVLETIGAGGDALVDVRSPAGVLGRADRAARLRAGGRPARRAHPDRAVDPVGPGRQGRRNLQGGGRAARALRRARASRRTRR